MMKDSSESKPECCVCYTSYGALGLFLKYNIKIIFVAAYKRFLVDLVMFDHII